MKISEVFTQKPLSADQARLKQLKATKDSANDALKRERERQKRTKAMKTLHSLGNPTP